jgi:hypothetical protein
VGAAPMQEINRPRVGAEDMGAWVFPCGGALLGTSGLAVTFREAI